MNKARASRKGDCWDLLPISNSSIVCNQTKMPPAPVMFLATVTAGKNCLENRSSDDSLLALSSAC